MQEKIDLKIVTETDLKELWEISYGPKADLEWMKYDVPYFEDPIDTWDEFANGFGKTSINHPLRRMVMFEDEIIGLVTAHWEDGDLKQWLEVGIVLYKAESWGKGIGSAALTQWLNYLFGQFDYLPHIGFTTWSGNLGMQKTGEKAQMQKEGVIRQVRYWQGRYYDSVKYGILKHELKD